MKTLLLLLVVCVAAVAGCNRIARPGARQHVPAVDGNLFAQHFEGDALNAGGKAKLDALPTSGPTIIVIHLTRLTDRHVFVRRARDVRAYAKERGLVDAQVRFDAEYEDVEPYAFDPMQTTTACVADDNR